MNNYNLFLDDKRNPIDCRNFSGDESVYETEKWKIARSFDEFYNTIKEFGVPMRVSFDYDLGEKHTGIDCAEFLKHECTEANVKIPECIVHSAWPGISDVFYEILTK